jgi:hypothetical protein
LIIIYWLNKRFGGSSYDRVLSSSPRPSHMSGLLYEGFSLSALDEGCTLMLGSLRLPRLVPLLPSAKGQCRVVLPRAPAGLLFQM